MSKTDKNHYLREVYILAITVTKNKKIRALRKKMSRIRTVRVGELQI